MSDGDTRIAYTGKSFKDARERLQKGEDNQVTAEQMQKWIDDIDDPNHQYAQSLRNKDDGDFFYALHICKENCKRTDNTTVGGGSLTFVSEGWAGAAPHFKRRIGGTVDVCDGICDAKTIFENDNKFGEKERAPNNPQMKNILRLKIDENNQPSIEKLFVEIVQWPRRIDDNTKEEIKDYLGNQLGERISNSDYILVNKEYDDYNQTEPRLSYVDGNLEANLWMKCFKKNTVRIFRHRGRMNQAGREKIGDFYEWIGEEKGGERNFKYDKNDLLLLWIPDKDDNCTDDSDWRDRCEDNVKIIIDELETDNLTKGSFKTFRNKKYKGFFILIGNRKEGKGDQVPFLKVGNPINRLFAALKESRRSNVIRRIPLYSFSQKEANMRITWLDGNNIFHALDDGLEHSLQSVNGEVSIIVSLNEIEEDQDNKFRTSIQLRLIDENGLKPIKGKAFIVDGKNASISLRFRKKGDYRLLLKTSNSQYRKLHISVENDSGNPNSIYCQEEGWEKWSETKVVHRYVAEPNSQKKLMQKIIKQEYPKLNNYIEYNDSEWKKKKNRNGLMMEINRAAFQLIQEKTGKSYVDGGSWTRKTRDIYSSIEWLHWPNMEDDERLEVPKIGVLQKRSGDPISPVAVVNNESHQYADLNCSYDDLKWAWQEYYQTNQGQHFLLEELTKGNGVVYASKTFKNLVHLNSIEDFKIYIDYETGFRYFDYEVEDGKNFWDYSEPGKKELLSPSPRNSWSLQDYLQSVRPYGLIDGTAKDFLYSFWNEIESFAEPIDDSTYKSGWETRRFSFIRSVEKTGKIALRELSEKLTNNLENTKKNLRRNWTKQFSEAMGVDVDWKDYDWLGEEMEILQEFGNLIWPGKQYYLNGGRRKLFLELEYYNSNYNLGEEKIPVNLYLGCLYNLDLEDFSEKIHEKRIRIASSNGWREFSKYEPWVDKKNRVSKTRQFAKNRENNLRWISNSEQQQDGLDDADEEDLRMRLHFSWPINAFSDTRYVEREVLRAFRSIYESENNITTDPTKTGGRDIPGFLYDEDEYRDWLWNVRIDGLRRCFPNEYDSEQIEQIKINYQKKILNRLWWNLDES